MLFEELPERCPKCGEFMLSEYSSIPGTHGVLTHVECPAHHYELVAQIEDKADVEAALSAHAARARDNHRPTPNRH